MKYLLWLIAIFALALGCVYVFSIMDGKIFLLLGTTTYAVTLRWLFLVLVLVALVFFIVYKIVHFVWRLPGRLGDAHARRKHRKIAENLTSALVSFFEGRYNQTLNLTDSLSKNRKLGELKPAVVLLAAESADRINDFAKRDDYLNLLLPHDLGSDVLPNLLRARGALKEQHYLDYEKYRDEVAEHNPKLTALAELQLEYGEQIGSGDAILDATRQLKNNEAISAVDFKRYQLLGFNLKVAAIHNGKELTKYIKSLDSALFQNTEAVLAVARKYYELQWYDSAVAFALKYYPEHRSTHLLTVILNSFDYLDDKAQLKLIATLEEWLDKDRDNMDLLSLLGDISYQKQLWGKAKSYLEVCASHRPTIAVLTTLAKLYERQGQEFKAKETQEKILALVAQGH